MLTTTFDYASSGIKENLLTLDTRSARLTLEAAFRVLDPGEKGPFIKSFLYHASNKPSIEEICQDYGLRTVATFGLVLGKAKTKVWKHFKQENSPLQDSPIFTGRHRYPTQAEAELSYDFFTKQDENTALNLYPEKMMWLDLLANPRAYATIGKILSRGEGDFPDIRTAFKMMGSAKQRGSLGNLEQQWAVFSSEVEVAANIETELQHLASLSNRKNMELSYG